MCHPESFSGRTTGLGQWSYPVTRPSPPQILRRSLLRMTSWAKQGHPANSRAVPTTSGLHIPSRRHNQRTNDSDSDVYCMMHSDPFMATRRFSEA